MSKVSEMMPVGKWEIKKFKIVKELFKVKTKVGSIEKKDVMGWSKLPEAFFMNQPWSRS